MNKGSDILSYLTANKKRLQREYHITQIALFGSFARGENTPKSDIDLLVEFEPETKNLYDLKKELKAEMKSVFNREVDICRIKYLKPYIKNRIITNAKYI